MVKNIKAYLAQLKRELKGCDAAVVQDALSDAEEHLRTALDQELETSPGIDEETALQPIIEKYGEPCEIAAAYRDIEAFLSSRPKAASQVKSRSALGRFLHILADQQAWSALLYMLFSFLTGIIYFLWGACGAMLSGFSLILIIGIPLTWLFLLSIRGIALMEGRIVEALLGVRMPRKPVFVRKNLRWRDRFRNLITESFTWRALGYLIIHFPLGFIYLFLSLIWLAFAVKFLIYPLWYLILHRPLLHISSEALYPPVWMFPLISIVGFIMIVVCLHLAKWIGKQHAGYAKFMLVRK